MKEKRMTFLFVFLSLIGCIGLGALLYWYRGLGYLLLLPVLLFLLSSYFFLTLPSRKKRADQQKLSSEFVTLFSFFAIYIRDGFNVYNALEKILGFASPEFAALLKKLLGDIDEDKTVTPFIAFGSHFDNLSIREVMIAIFQMVEEGGGSPYVARFEHLFSRLSDDAYLRDGEKAMGRLETLAFLPLAGSGIAMLMLTIGIVGIMGEVLNGL